MNETNVIIGFAVYALFIFIIALTSTYQLFIERDTIKDKWMYPVNIFIQDYVAPAILKENVKKDYRLNMKRRPPIIWVAH